MNFKILAIILLSVFLFQVAFARLEITDVQLSNDVFYPGNVVFAHITIENSNSKEVQYSFEYTVGNEVYHAGDVSYIQGNSEKDISIPIEVPDTYDFDLTVKVYGNDSSSDSYSDTYLISQKYKFFYLTLADETAIINAGNSFATKLNIYNIGNEDDSYTIDIYGWSYYNITNNTVSIDTGVAKNLNIKFDIPADSRVGNYPITIEVCNTNDTCRAKTFWLVVSRPEAEQSLISWNENLTKVNFNETGKAIVYKFDITNLGGKIKDYSTQVEISDDLASNISASGFKLLPDEQKTIVLKLTPSGKENYTARMKITARNTVIFDQELTLEYSEHPEASALTGFFISGVEGSYTFGLLLLAIVGVAFIALTFYSKIRQKMWTEKVLAYQKRPNMYNVYTNTHPRSNMANMYGPQTVMPQGPTNSGGFTFSSQPVQPTQQDTKPDIEQI